MDERAEMPTCNLAETVHNKWLQQSGNRVWIVTHTDLIKWTTPFIALTLGLHDQA